MLLSRQGDIFAVVSVTLSFMGPPLQLPQAEVSESTLVMQIHDFNRFAKHDTIGEVRLPLASVDLQHVIEQWSDLAMASKVEVGGKSPREGHVVVPLANL